MLSVKKRILINSAKTLFFTILVLPQPCSAGFAFLTRDVAAMLNAQQKSIDIEKEKSQWEEAANGQSKFSAYLDF